MASTLALGQAQYDLLEIEAPTADAPKGGVLESSGEGVVRLFADESGEVNNINVGITTSSCLIRHFIHFQYYRWSPDNNDFS